MKKVFIKLTCVLAAFLCFSVALPATIAESYVLEKGENDVDNEALVQQNQRRRKFQQERLSFIVKVADLNNDEKEWLDKELKKYDDERAGIWLEMREVRAEVKKAGEDLTDKEYSEYLNTLILLHKKLGDTHKNFAEVLMNRFSPKKAYIVFDSLRNHNSRMARSVRED